MPTICSYCNPLSGDFNALQEFRTLSCKQKTLIGLITALCVCTILLIPLATPVFRLLVGCSTPKPADLTDTENNTSKVFKKTIPVNYPDTEQPQNPITPIENLEKPHSVQTSLTIEEITNRVLEDIPSLKNWNLNEVQTLALGLLYCAMKDKNHPSFITERLHPKPEHDYEAEIANLSRITGKDPETIKNLDNPVTRIKSLEQYMDKIQIEISSEKMIDTFNKHGIIQLRSLEHADILVLGCGNTPASRVHYRTQDESHDHIHTDTMNINMNMNPSVVAFWGYEQNDTFFKNRQKKYKLVVDEGPICSFLEPQGHIDQYFRAARGALQAQGYLAIPSHVISFPIPPDFVRIDNPSTIDDPIVKEARKQNIHTVTLFQYRPN